MGNGMCSRKQKRIFQTLLLLTVVFGFLYGAMLYYELQTQLRKAEAVALKYQQHQESLSAQLQGTVNGRTGPVANFVPRLRPRWKSGFGEQLALRVPPLTFRDIRGEPCRVPGPVGVSGEVTSPSSRFQRRLPLKRGTPAPGPVGPWMGGAPRVFYSSTCQRPSRSWGRQATSPRSASGSPFRRDGFRVPRYLLSV